MLFTLDDTSTGAGRLPRVGSTKARGIVTEADLLAADGAVRSATGAYQETFDELTRKQELANRNSSAVATAEIDRLTSQLESRSGALETARAQKVATERRLQVLLPAQQASAEAALEQAQVELDKMVVYAGVTGTLEQFALQPGDFVSPILRPAGLVPDVVGRRRFETPSTNCGPGPEGRHDRQVSRSAPVQGVPDIVVDIKRSRLVSSAARRAPMSVASPHRSIITYLNLLRRRNLDSVGNKCTANATDNRAIGFKAGTELGFSTILSTRSFRSRNDPEVSDAPPARALTHPVGALKAATA